MFGRQHNHRCSLALAISAMCAVLAPGQSPIAMPFDSNLRYSREVGNVEGIQRFGRQMKSDPDVGVGYDYLIAPGGFGYEANTEEKRIEARFKANLRTWVSVNQAIEVVKESNHPETEKNRILKELEARKQALAAEMLQLIQAWLNYNPNANSTIYSELVVLPYSVPRSVTGFLRQSYYGSGAQVGTLNFGISGERSTDTLETELPGLFHQPLVQVRVRVVEVTRSNTNQFNSILDYISQTGTPSLIDGNNLNSNRRSTRGRSNPNVLNELLGPSDTNSNGLANTTDNAGTLVNLTTDHVNHITQLLATEFNGDVITAPEVVTLNGQNVEFVSGEKRPFPIGYSITDGDRTSTQDFYYKHVGAIISVTPRIVNWGNNHQGLGEATIVDHEIGNWNALAKWMSDPSNIGLYADQAALAVAEPGVENAERRLTLADLGDYKDSIRPIPSSIKTKMLDELAEYSSSQLRRKWRQFCSPAQPTVGPHRDDSETDLLPPPAALEPIVAEELSLEETGREKVCGPPILREEFSCSNCEWKPEDCTIDLEIYVKLSEANDAIEGARAISNVIQVKSGNGLVMGGLIGARELSNVSKTPVLGDLPFVGNLFRSKSTSREKTEVLIFVEAEVLPQPDLARHESARDFALSRDYIDAGITDTRLEYGMCRAGFGSYLPPSCRGEDIYWQTHSREVRKVVTELDDTFK